MQPFLSVKLIAEAVLAVLATAAAIAGWPMLIAKARLVRERDEARRERDELRSMLGTFELGLRSLDRLRAEIEELRAVQIIATRYIGELVAFIRDERSADSMPRVPPELRDDVLDTLRNRTTPYPSA